MKNLIILTTAIIGAAILLIYLNDIRKDRKVRVTISENTGYFEDFESLDPRSLIKPKGTIYLNEKLKVKRIRYGKDYMAIKVVSDSGKIGWIGYMKNIEIKK